MIYTCEYKSPLGVITLASDGTALTGLWFNGQKHFGKTLPQQITKHDISFFEEVKNWLDIYFTGNAPNFTPALNYGSTPFQKAVYDIMLTIPYGQTMTYGEIAKLAAIKFNVSKMSAQAVGGAVGHNPISLIIPCHRVIGSNRNLTGYAGGINRKIKLLELEQIDIKKFFIPTKGTTL